MRIYLSELSLRRTIRERDLRVAELPAFVREHGYDGLELSDRTPLGYDSDARRAFSTHRGRAGIGFVFDISCDLTRSDDAAAGREVEHVLRMIDVAGELEAEAARIWLGGQFLSLQRLKKRTPPGRAGSSKAKRKKPGFVQLAMSSAWLADTAHAVRLRLPSRVIGARSKIERAVSALRRIVPRAESLNLPLAIENHWGLSSRPENILAVLAGVASDLLGTCPDFGNFPRDVDRYEALRQLAPHATLVHAKSARFDPSGQEREIDYPRCLAILRGSGFSGPFTVEFVGAGDELEGCARTRELLRENWPETVG